MTVTSLDPALVAGDAGRVTGEHDHHDAQVQRFRIIKQSLLHVNIRQQFRFSGVGSVSVSFIIKAAALTIFPCDR